MLRNYIKTAWRNLSRNKGYAAINIIGLAVGIAACLLSFLIVQFETSFDDFHSKKCLSSRLNTVFTGPDGVHPTSGTAVPMSEGLRIDFPQLKDTGAILRDDSSHYGIGNGRGQAVKKFKEDDAYYAEPEFFGYKAVRAALANPLNSLRSE